MLFDSDSRRSRADHIIETLSPNEKTRHDEAVNTLKIHWAAMYGDRLNPLVVENMSAEAILNIDVLEAIHGQPPQSDASWRAVAKEIADKDEWVARSLAYSDERAKAEIRERVLSELPGHRKLTMQRSGELDNYVADAVRDVLETGFAQRGA